MTIQVFSVHGTAFETARPGIEVEVDYLFGTRIVFSGAPAGPTGSTVAAIPCPTIADGKVGKARSVYLEYRFNPSAVPVVVNPPIGSLQLIDGQTVIQTWGAGSFPSVVPGATQRQDFLLQSPHPITSGLAVYIRELNIGSGNSLDLISVGVEVEY